MSNMYALILYQQAVLRLQMCGTEGQDLMNVSNNVWFIKAVDSNAPDAYVSPVDEISKNVAKISLGDKFDTKTPNENLGVQKTPATFIKTKKPVNSKGMTRSCRAPTKKAPKTVLRNYLDSLGTSTENQSKLRDRQKCASLMYEFGTTDDDDDDIGSDECFVEGSYKDQRTKSSARVSKRGKSRTQRTRKDLNIACQSKLTQPELPGLFVTPKKSRRKQLKRYPTATELDTSGEIPEQTSDRLLTDKFKKADFGDDTVQKVLHSRTKENVFEASSPSFNKDSLLNTATICQVEKENSSDLLNNEKQLKTQKNNKTSKNNNSVKEVPKTKRITRLRKKQNNESTKMTVEHPRDDDSSVLNDMLISPVLEFVPSPDIPLKDSEFFKNWSPKLSEIELIASEGKPFYIGPRNKQKSVTFSLSNDTFMSKVSDVGSPEVFRVTEEAPVTSSIRNHSSSRKPLNKRNTKATNKNPTNSIILKSESHDTSDKEEATCSVVRSSVSESNLASLLSSHETMDVRSNLEMISPQSQLTENWCEENYKGTLLMKIKEDLSEALTLIQHHPPCPLYGNICQLLALLSGVEDNGFPDVENQKMTAAHYFSESVAVTMRHQASICLTKKIRNTSTAAEVIPVETPPFKESQKFTTEGTDEVQKQILQFSDDQNFQKIMERIDFIPKGWTVIQVCGVPQDVCLTAKLSHFTVPDLLVCRYRHGRTPTFVLFNSSQDTQFQTSFLKEFHTILEESAATMQKEDPKTWWTIRYALDNRLKELTESMENMWLGCWKGVFLGKVDDENYTSALKNTIKDLVEITSSQGLHCNQEDLLEILVDSSSHLNNKQLSSCINHLWNVKATDSVHQNIFKIIRDSEKKPSNSCNRQPVLLILDKYVQPLPWESLPMLQHSPVSRIPSLHLLHSQLSLYRLSPNTIFNRGINSTKTYYVLNPSNDIPHTQKKFEEVFKSMKGWNGIVGQKPSNQELASALTENDLFLYCGHGSGRVYLAGESIERLQCRSASVLMGCSSGKLKVFGQQLEPTGVVLQYWLGGSPCVVANLWDVTDKDIDRFTESLLELWLPNWKNEAKDIQASFITAALPVARQACKLKYLIGSAPVIYGLPVFTVK
ncbi:uncharacterized protein LOC106465616 [Limulus polyphemus]|uniref:separase n=1 Tax=Limulus polyphemus TaxID=6850 RepID=A0ABM1BG27_LIMPO|nr:uncharacterized protein LOC106465616 [Limulus polyphemus]